MTTSAHSAGSVVVVLYGPKAVGKSAVAGLLHQHLGVHPVDADTIVLGLLSEGIRPDPRSGWLRHVEDAVHAARVNHPAVSVEATGAYESDWLLATRLLHAGVRVVTLWIHAPEAVALERLAARPAAGKVHVSEEDARRVRRAALERASQRRFCVTIDTSAPLDGAEVAGAVGPHLSPGWCSAARRCGPWGLGPVVDTEDLA